MAIPDFSNVRVLVVGDLMLDIYIHGTTSRISPEAPVPVVRVDREEVRIGGAGNVSLNVASLGARSSILALVGLDEYAASLRGMIEASGADARLVSVSEKSTIRKKRVISRNHQLIRIDHESKFDSSESESLLPMLGEWLPKVDVLVLSDYAKGTLIHAPKMIELSRAANKPVLVDPKGSDFSRYRGATLVTPNLNEFEAVVGVCEDDHELAVKAMKLLADFNFEGVLVTKSERGMTLVRRGEAPMHFPALAREVYDVTGAGDTVIATVAAGIGAGMSIENSVNVANVAAGVVVGKFGTATVTSEELKTRMRRLRGAATPKIVNDLETLLEIIKEARDNGEALVLTNGCFDLLHPGHIDYLRRSRTLGDRLIVLVNDDASVACLKGPQRPVNSLDFRKQMLSALECVDYVCHFSDLTPERYIKAIRPEVLVKGGDYTAADVVGGDFVMAYGGRVEILPYVEGHSSSSMIERIKGV